MVKANDSSPFQPSAWQLPNLNCMSTSQEPRQLECLPTCVNPGSRMFPASMSMPGSANPGTNPGIHFLSENPSTPWSAVPGISSLNVEQTYETHGLPQYLHSHIPTLLPYAGTYKERQPTDAYGYAGKATANVMSRSLQKGLLIFDRSGNQTRFIYSAFQPPAQYATTPVTQPFSSDDLRGGQAVQKSPPMHTVSHERYNQNGIVGEESEMHEDTEEINALLYSDEENDYNDDDDDHVDDDDEVMSTDHSPPVTAKRKYPIEDVKEEVASSDGPNKRHKLRNCGYKISPLMDAGSSAKSVDSHEYHSEAESSCAIGRDQRKEVGSILGNKRLRKDKIRMTLKILESVIPGVKGKDPSSVLDEAIEYLKSLKLKAKTLGLSHY